LTGEQVLAFVVANPGCTSIDVGQAFGSNSKAAGAHLSRLAVKRLIIQRGTVGAFIYGPLGWTPRSKIRPPSIDTAEDRIAEIDEMLANLQREKRALLAFLAALRP
jgi:hypothetical protein